jgi:uncharacterized membrane protein YgdD (TMEM256/DUF423 family)
MIRFAGLFGALAVLTGAFGAHALKERLPADLLAVWNTGAHYHLVHSAVLLALGLVGARDARVRLPFLLIATGVVIFSGSLYALALSGIRPLGAVTPIGGVLMVAGWISIAWVLGAKGSSNISRGER